MFALKSGESDFLTELIWRAILHNSLVFCTLIIYWQTTSIDLISLEKQDANQTEGSCCEEKIMLTHVLISSILRKSL